MGQSADVRAKPASGLFSGESAASKGFELAVLAAAAALVAHVVAFASPAPSPGSSLAGLAGGLAAAVAVVTIALAGVFPLPLGRKAFLSLGSGVAFAALLVFPLREALALAFSGTLIAQVVRRQRGYRLTPSTILFNQMQYLVTWSLAAGIYLRVRSDVAAHPAFAWLPAVVAGTVYVLVNSWLVTTWGALRKRMWTWDLWMRRLRDAWLGYAASLCLGAVLAALAVTHPPLVLPLIAGMVLLYVSLAHTSRFRLRQTSAVLAALIESAERRSPHTVEHSERVSWWAERLARRLHVPEGEIEEVAIAAKLHDLGKVVLPKDLEDKPGPLTPDEWAVMRQHPGIGADIIRRLPGMETVARYVRYHHERYDGEGYPDGLEGEAIPLGARIIAAADSFDAMLSSRPYRPGLAEDEALARIAGAASRQFDPAVASALVTLARADGRRGEPARRPVPALALATAGGPALAVPASLGRIVLGEIFPEVDATETLAWGVANASTQPAASLLSSQLMAAQEAERRRIARELHDEIGQALTGLKFMLDTAPRLSEQKAGTTLREAQALITDLMGRIHNLSLDLRPALLDDMGLRPALAAHIEQFASRTGIRVAFEQTGLDRRFDPTVETAAYRIVQEALTNAARHAGAREVTVRLRAAGSALRIVVEDRGRGFDPAEIRAAGRASGLAGMRERALLLGGHFAVDSTPGAGTRITAELPLEIPAAAPSGEYLTVH
jgi:signal transduction histidine kinase